MKYINDKLNTCASRLHCMTVDRRERYSVFTTLAQRIGRASKVRIGGALVSYIRELGLDIIFSIIQHRQFEHVHEIWEYVCMGIRLYGKFIEKRKWIP